MVLVGPIKIEGTGMKLFYTMNFSGLIKFSLSFFAGKDKWSGDSVVLIPATGLG